MDTLCFPVKRADHFMYPAAMFRTPQRPGHGGLDKTPVVWGRSEPAYAFDSGIVVIADHTAEAGDASGIDIMIRSDQTGILGWYGHLAAGNVFRGQRVRKGQHIGYTGSTGNSSACHLHFEMHYPSINVEIDPWPWIWDAPDVDGSVMPLAPTREKALADYPKYVKPGSKPKPPVKTPEQIEEEELMGAVKELEKIIKREIAEESSRRRADTRGFITLDCGEPFHGDVERAEHAVLIAMNGELRVMHPPVSYGMGQINSTVNGKGSNGSDYRWVDPKRPYSPLSSGKFWNRVKDTLKGLNYFGDDRDVTVEDAQAWVAKWEQRLAAEAMKAG